MLPKMDSGGSGTRVVSPQELQLGPLGDRERRRRPRRKAQNRSSIEALRRWRGVSVDLYSTAIAVKSGELLIQGTLQIGHLEGLTSDAPPRKLYLQTVMDAHCGLAFAKVYVGTGPQAAVNILEERVLPFYAKHGVQVQEIETKPGGMYCGRLLAHPYELFLETIGIKHRIARAPADPALACLDSFQRILRDEFIIPELRKRLRGTLSQMQADLDAFLKWFNRERVVVSPSGRSRTPYAIFLEDTRVSARAE